MISAYGIFFAVGAFFMYGSILYNMKKFNTEIDIHLYIMNSFIFTIIGSKLFSALAYNSSPFATTGFASHGACLGGWIWILLSSSTYKQQIMSSLILSSIIGVFYWGFFVRVGNIYKNEIISILPFAYNIPLYIEAGLLLFLGNIGTYIRHRNNVNSDENFLVSHIFLQAIGWTHYLLEDYKYYSENTRELVKFWTLICLLITSLSLLFLSAKKTLSEKHLH